MTDHLTENARLRAALEKALKYIENTESELGITLDCGDTARAALATPAPDAVQEAGADYAAGFAEGIRRAAEASHAWMTSTDKHISDARLNALTQVLTGEGPEDADAQLVATAILALTPGDPAAAAARVLLDSEGRALPRLVQIAEDQWDAGSSMSRCIGVALRAIAGGQP